MRHLHLDLARRALVAHFAVAAGVAVLVGVAALAEGRPPELARLRSVTLPAAAYLGGAWAIARWRAEGAPIAVAALGRRPGWLLAAPFVVGLACLAVGTPEVGARTPPSDLKLQPESAVVRHPGGEARFTWRHGVARRHDGATFAGLPPPEHTSTAPPPPSRWPGLAAHGAALLALLAWLALRLEAPGMPLAVAGAAAAFLAARLGSYALT